MRFIKSIIIVVGVSLISICCSFAQPSKIEKTLKPFYGFKAKVGDRSVSMKCDNCGAFSVNNGILKAKGFGNLWTDRIVYDVTGNKKVVVEATTRLRLKSGKGKERGSSFMVGFSMNLSGWGSNTEDALTFRIGCDRDENNFFTVVRSGMYKNYVATSRYILPPGKRQTIKIILTSSKLIAYVENSEVIRADLSGTEFPKVGHIGLLSYRNVSTEIEYINVYPE